MTDAIELFFRRIESLTTSLRLVSEDYYRYRQARAAAVPAQAGMGEENRESLGRLVREIWVEWAREQPNPKPSWLAPWEVLSEPDREVDRRIGERLYGLKRPALRARIAELEQRAEQAEADLTATRARLAESAALVFANRQDGVDVLNQLALSDVRLHEARAELFDRAQSAETRLADCELELTRVGRERDEARALVELWRPVVEAARVVATPSWLAHHEAFGQCYQVAQSDMDRLRDALRAAQKGADAGGEGGRDAD